MSLADEWPAEDLEHLGHCPACLSENRSLAFSGLRDLAFGAAPGEWSAWRCNQCQCAYLDPRPSPETIGRAYENYYTHGSEQAFGEGSARGWIGAARAAVKTAFYRLSSAGPLRILVDKVPRLRRSRARIAQRFRHLPLKGGRLLDVGCGSGDFLAIAKELGYEALGTDFDPVAVATVRRRGLDAQCAPFPGSEFAPESFDHVTLDNVLEHLHDPVGALQEAHRLLRPGGRLWLSQPNLDAIGLATFGVYWRGLEPPRHLTLWGVPSLTRLLSDCGFVGVTLADPCPTTPGWFFAQSQLHRLGATGHASVQTAEDDWDDATQKALRIARKAVDEEPMRAEAITLYGWKAG